MKPRKGSAYRRRGSLLVVAKKIVQPLPRGMPVRNGVLLYFSRLMALARSAEDW